MKKVIYISYAVCAIAMLVLLFYVSDNLRVIESNTREDNEYTQLRPYTTRVVKDSGAPIGISKVFQFKVPAIGKGTKTLAFYCHHQDVVIYKGDKVIYQRRVYRGNPFGRTSGQGWNNLTLYSEDSGKNLTVVISPEYSTVQDVDVTFYYGSELEIWLHDMIRQLPPSILSIVAIVMGMIFVIFTLVNIRNKKINRDLLFMGIFSVCIGAWKITDAGILQLLFGNNILLSYIPFVSLLLSVIPFVLFIRTLFADREAKGWYIVCLASLAVMVFSFVVQILNKGDMRETLPFNHVVMGVMALVTAIQIVRQWKKQGMNRKLKLIFCCFLTCIVGLIGDTITFYTTEGTGFMVLGIFGFILFIIIVGINSLAESRVLMARGEQAEQLEKMAYHDQLTGVYNRTAYAAHTTAEDFEKDQCIVVMMDLNNLKKCNDTRGHEEGDAYIKASVELILQTLGTLGNCYRMGGDEFCVLIHGGTPKACSDQIRKLWEKTEQFNKENPEAFPVHIAAGFVSYDKDKDYDFADTLRRADRLMYEKKCAMKHQQAECVG